MPLTKLLPVPLTDADRLTIQRDLSAAISALEQAETEKRDVVSTHNANIKGHKGSIHTLNKSLVTGTVDRDVEIQERPDYARKVVLIVRLDTGDVCGERAMDPDERQTKFKAVAGGKTDEKPEPDPKAEERAAALAEAVAGRVKEERERIVVTGDAGGTLSGTLQFGSRALTAIGGTDEEIRDGIVKQLSPLVEEQEEARLAEIAKLAEAQAADAEGKPGKKRGSPKKRKGARAEATT